MYTKLAFMLSGMILFCFLLFLARASITGTTHYLFLNWNLFLAAIPWMLSLFILDLKKERTLSKLFLFVIWLIFFPNSLYILTDLFHLHNYDSAPKWFDLILITSYAWTGLFLGFSSLSNIGKTFRSYFSKAISGIILVLLLFAGSFGVYVGRYLRWNSWDFLTDPFGLTHDLAIRLIHPIQHSRTWGMTILLGLLLNFIFWSFVPKIKNE